jgi:hypothetical protein
VLLSVFKETDGFPLTCIDLDLAFDAITAELEAEDAMLFGVAEVAMT